MKLRTHCGAGMYGSTSVRWRIISKDADPDPMTTPAWKAIVGTPDSISTLPTFSRLRRWRLSESTGTSGCRPPR